MFSISMRYTSYIMLFNLSIFLLIKTIVFLPPQSGWMPCDIVVCGERWGSQTSTSELLLVGWCSLPVRSLKSSWTPTRKAISRCDPGWISQSGSALWGAHWLTSPQLGSCCSEMLCVWSDGHSPSVPECHHESQDAGKRAFAEVAWHTKVRILCNKEFTVVSPGLM